MSKYAEDIARIDERTSAILNMLDKDIREHLKKLNASQGKQWDAINEARNDMARLEERQKAIEKEQSDWNKGLIIFSTAISAIAGTIAGIVGIRK